MDEKELAVNNTLEESELILSGIVLQKQDKLRIYNRIYESVFNSIWVEEIVAARRPYAEKLIAWRASKREDETKLLKGGELRKALDWSRKKILSVEDYQFFKASQEREIHNYKTFLASICSLTIVVLLLGGQFKNIKSFFLPYVLEPELFSKGEKTFFLGRGNLYQEYGINAFQKSDYQGASAHFKTATEIESNDPELLIYYNNALAHKKDNFLTLAVAVPINARRDAAREILRGVAQAQNEFNQRDGINSQLLNIIIADDNNDSNQGQRVAQEFIKDKNVLGVIGHNGSSVSQAAVLKYQNSGLAMISPTSTSTELNQKNYPVFFRTIPSDAKNGEVLANYAIETGIKKVVIFYRDQDIYSESLKEAFKNTFEDEDRKVVNTINLADPNLDAFNVVARSVVKNQADAAIFFPNLEAISTVINIAREKQNITPQLGKNLDLLGGDALYGADTLRQGNKAVEGLVLAIPWFGEESNSFAQEACNTWGGGVSWRTAASYDATQAFIAAISKSENPTRTSVLENLKSIRLPPEETSGNELDFQNGERNQEPVLVRVVSGRGNNCSGLDQGGFYFEKVE
ncbi:ABC transporter substrate-binding protein [Nodularia sp. NIES-3585]|uniref:ABC transporter substrate-binding protein n=1 Tax=Nodularia sp. NIES-3585 TaxID=1973477 RepID=UPI000B71A0B5|nr:ABC transporter substrate-binding protein [Nodularia sp. NIES-3585]GAX36448.1 hypothetical protein NIES3585_24810 [Nodularia sp. NIES-3585]